MPKFEYAHREMQEKMALLVVQAYLEKLEAKEIMEKQALKDPMGQWYERISHIRLAQLQGHTSNYLKFYVRKYQ